MKSTPNKGSLFAFVMKVFEVINPNVVDRSNMIIEEEKIDVESEEVEEWIEDESHLFDLAF